MAQYQLVREVKTTVEIAHYPGDGDIRVTTDVKYLLVYSVDTEEPMTQSYNSAKFLPHAAKVALDSEGLDRVTVWGDNIKKDGTIGSREHSREFYRYELKRESDKLPGWLTALISDAEEVVRG